MKIKLQEGQQKKAELDAQLADAQAQLDAALADVKKGKGGDFPRQLQNKHADTYGMEREQGYKYPHSYPHHYVKQQYLPDAIKDTVYYTPGDNKTEQAFAAYWKDIKK